MFRLRAARLAAEDADSRPRPLRGATGPIGNLGEAEHRLLRERPTAQARQCSYEADWRKVEYARSACSLHRL